MTAETRPLPAFDYFAPSSLAEAVGLLKQHGSEAKLLAGGTDLLPRMKKSKDTPSVIVDLNRVSGLSFIEIRGDELRIGAGTRFSELKDSAVIAEKAGALADAIRILGSPGIRNRATIGGNLCNASRCADTPPPLLALDASVKLRGPDGERVVTLLDFFTGPGKKVTGPGKTVMQPDEIMTEVIIPYRPGRSAFIRFGRRKGSSIAIASVAAFAAIKDGKFEAVHIALGACAAIPFRSEKVETALKGMAVNEKNIESASALIKAEINPLHDVRASAAYRREMACVMIKRTLTKVAMGER